MMGMDTVRLKIGILCALILLIRRFVASDPEVPEYAFQDSYLTLEERIGICDRGSQLYFDPVQSPGQGVCGCCLESNQVWVTDCIDRSSKRMWSSDCDNQSLDKVWNSDCDDQSSDVSCGTCLKLSNSLVIEISSYWTI